MNYWFNDTHAFRGRQAAIMTLSVVWKDTVHSGMEQSLLLFQPSVRNSLISPAHMVSFLSCVASCVAFFSWLDHYLQHLCFFWGNRMEAEWGVIIRSVKLRWCARFLHSAHYYYRFLFLEAGALWAIIRMVMMVTIDLHIEFSMERKERDTIRC